MDMVLRIAAIGCGDIAQRRHFPQIEALHGTAELVAIAGRDRTRLKDCAARFKVPRWYTDPAAMLRDVAIDAVLVLTPPDSHAEYAEMAVRAGKHVMVEKPLVTAVDEALRLCEAVRSQQSVKPITFFPLPNVGTAEHGLVDRLLQAGAVGEVTSVECHRGHRGPTHASWFYQKHLAGGGVLFDLGIYGLTTVATLFGPTVSMTASCSRRFETRVMDDGTVVRPDVEDSALISLLLEDKIAVSVNANWNGCLSHHHTRMRVVVIGREGMLHFGVVDGAVYVHRPDGNYQVLPAGSDAGLFDGYACRKFAPGELGRPSSIIGDFVAKIEAGDTSTRSLDIQTHVLEIITKAYESADSEPAISIVKRF
jgi:1,5-anhydro-D-fructose reductase (1,5-anhydro-D-mannitol-forming)